MVTEHEQEAAGICRAIEAICNRGDFAAADALFTDDYVNHGGLIPGYCQDKFLALRTMGCAVLGA
jgi:hypothetical protein